MPTYEYRCENGHQFEAFQKMSDEPLGECPECGGSAQRKISSGAGLVFKGTGFYITDYKNAGRDKGEKKKSGEGKSDGGNGKKSSSGDGSSKSSGGSSNGSAGADPA